MKRYFLHGQQIFDYRTISHAIRFWSVPKRSGTVYIGSKGYIQRDIHIQAPQGREPPTFEKVTKDMFRNTIEGLFPHCECVEDILDNREKEHLAKKDRLMRLELQYVALSGQHKTIIKQLAEMEKGPRTTDVDITKYIVAAYIRHNHTEYDKLYAIYSEKEKNRAIVHDKVQYIFKQWAGTWKDKDTVI